MTGRRYDRAAQAIELYHETVLEGMHAFLASVGAIEEISPTRARQVLIVFGSDHGLCGNYNEALAQYVLDQIDGTTAPRPHVLCIGAQMADALADQHISVDQTLFPAASVDGIGRLANLLTRRLEEIRKEDPARELAVSLAYVTRGDTKGQFPVFTSLLPVDDALLADLQSKPWTSRSRPFFTMPPDDLFMALVRSHLFATLFRAIAEALMTENAARLALMQQAETSVDDRLEDLISETRAVRQDEITTELLDVIIGFEALKKGKSGNRRELSKGSENDHAISKSAGEEPC